MHSQTSSRPSQQLAASQNSTRRELLRVVLRDTLTRHGIPSAWISAELLNTTARTGERGLHWRLHVKHWDPRLLTHGVALQNALIKRLVAFDPMVSGWLTGISWQFSMDDESQCPPLPHPSTWTMQPRVVHTEPTDGYGDSAGPLHIGGQPVTGAPDPARADLEQLLAVRDADFREHAGAAAPTWASTEPAKM